MATATRKPRADVRAALADHLDDVRVDIYEMYAAMGHAGSKIEAHRLRVVVAALRDGEPAEVRGDSLSFALWQIGEREDALRVGRRGGDWTVHPDGTFAPA